MGNKTDVLSINRYIYANDNPLRYTDPSGNVIIETYLLYEIAFIVGGLITATYASIKLGEIYRNHPVDIFPRSYIPQSSIIDIPSSDLPTTNVDVFPRVETPSPNILVTPTDNIIDNSIVGDIIIAEENSAQISCSESNNSAKINYNGEEVSVYRGVKNYDNRFKLRSSDIKLDENGNVSTKSGGASVNVDPNRVTNFGKAYELKSLPDGLKIEQSGSDPGHFEVRPQYPMPVQEYQDLLNQIELFK